MNYNDCMDHMEFLRQTAKECSDFSLQLMEEMKELKRENEKLKAVENKRLLNEIYCEINKTESKPKSLLTDEERKQHRKAANQRYYQKRKLHN